MVLYAMVWSAWLLAGEPQDERAPTPAVELTWSAPEGCPTAQEVEVAIVELIGRPLAEDPTRVLEVTGSIEASADAFVLAMRIEGAERRFEAPKCTELLGPAALVIAIAVDPTMGGEPESVPEAPAEKTTSAPPPASPSPPPAPPALTRTPARRWPVRAAIGVRGGIDGGNLPAPAGMIEGSVGAMIGRARVEVVALHLFRRTIRTERGGGEFRTTAARVQGCFAPGRGQISVPLCGGVEVGLLRGEGVNVERSNTARQLWLAFVGGAGVAWAVRPWLALLVRGDLVVSPLRHEFTLRKFDLVTTGPVGGRGLAGLEVRLP